jgi:tRNA pseudouridine55 synthase
MTSPNGLLLVDKPSGVTSHDVVARVRKILNERRVGHAGTLDPMATGLLLVAVGPCTRLLRFAQSETKRYSGVVLLGTATDSLDADGQVTASAPVPDVTEAKMNEIAATFLGDIEQVPPMVSAIKVGGRRLHELARAGEVVARAPRSLTIERFAMTATEDRTRWRFDVQCSTGTYVRVLLSDLAERAGTLGHLEKLQRDASGDHELTSALSLEEIEERGAAALVAPRCMVTALVHVTLSADQVRDVRHGKSIVVEGDTPSNEVAALDEDGDLVGVLIRRGERFKPDVILRLRDVDGAPQ